MSGLGGASRERRVRVAGREVRLLEQGAGPAVVLVHGLGLTATVWEEHLDRLASAGYRALAPDLPGFGDSDGSMRGMSMPESAQWLLRLADVLELDRAAWLGHSVGAQQVVSLAASAPERAAALILAAPTGRRGHRPLRSPLGLLATGFQERPRLVAGVLRRYLRSPLITMSTWRHSIRHQTALDAPLVKCPTLLVVGERDLVVPDHFVEHLQRLISDSIVVRIEGASHAVALDPVQPFMDVVLRFLTRRYGRSER